MNMPSATLKRKLNEEKVMKFALIRGIDNDLDAEDPTVLRWDSVTLSKSIIYVEEDDTEAGIRKKIKDGLDTKLLTNE